MTLCEGQVTLITADPAQAPIGFNKQTRNIHSAANLDRLFELLAGKRIIGLVRKHERMSLPHVTDSCDERRFQIIAAARAFERGLICQLTQPLIRIDQRKQEIRLTMCARHLNRILFFSLGLFFESAAGFVEPARSQPNAKLKLPIRWTFETQFLCALT